MHSLPSLRAQRSNPSSRLCPVFASAAKQSIPPPSLRAQRSNPSPPSLRAQRSNPSAPVFASAAKQSMPRPRLCERSEAIHSLRVFASAVRSNPCLGPVFASAAKQSIPAPVFASAAKQSMPPVFANVLLCSCQRRDVSLCSLQ